jgi:hypothetical protein
MGQTRRNGLAQKEAEKKEQECGPASFGDRGYSTQAGTRYLLKKSVCKMEIFKSKDF